MGSFEINLRDINVKDTMNKTINVRDTIKWIYCVSHDKLERHDTSEEDTERLHSDWHKWLTAPWIVNPVAVDPAPTISPVAMGSL